MGDVIRILVLIVPLLVLWYGLVLFAFFRYRVLRQEELAHVLAAAAESGAPLAPALWAYLRDRPRDEWRTFWMAVILFFTLPGYYFYWRRHNYERKVERLASMLETGFPLPEALRAARGAAPREVLLAASVGTSTGQLAACLRLAPRWRLTPVWLESGPRLLYPAFLLVSVYFVVAFLSAFIVPKFQKIFGDFKVRLPVVSELMFSAARWFVRYGGVVLVMAIPVGVILAVALMSPTLRWYFPGVGRLYRMHARSRVLRMLSVLLDSGKPLPQALEVLAESGYFRGTVLYRLAQVQLRIEQGEPLADSLRRAGLLPGEMVPLVHAAERANNLPWVLSTLGESLAQRAVRFSQRLSLAVFPVAIVIAGVVVAFVAFGMFMPLLTLLAEVGR